MLLCDIHTHSNNSFDGKNTVDEMCRSAIDKGLYALAVTDHCEAPFINCGEDCEFGSFDRQIPKLISDIESAKEKYGDKLRLLVGMELGEPMHDPDQTSKALAYGDFDFILASIHNIRGEEDFYYMDYSKADVNDILSRYFDELLETAAFPHFDSLAHLTYPLRYVFEREGYCPDLTPFMSKIDEIFRTLIKNEKALEINTQGLFKPIKQTSPDLPLVRRFRELGGKYITVGSDSHRADMVGGFIRQGIETARAAGFDCYYIYEKHKPVRIEIE